MRSTTYVHTCALHYTAHECKKESHQRKQKTQIAVTPTSLPVISHETQNKDSAGRRRRKGRPDNDEARDKLAIERRGQRARGEPGSEGGREGQGRRGQGRAGTVRARHREKGRQGSWIWMAACIRGTGRQAELGG